MSKRVIIGVVEFFVVFLLVYCILCYLPWFRIKLFAEPVEYFLASMRHNVMFKALASACVGIGVCFFTQIVAGEQ